MEARSESLAPGKQQPSPGAAALGRTARQGQRWELGVVPAQGSGVGPLLGSSAGLATARPEGSRQSAPSPSHPTSPKPPGASLCPFPPPSGPPRRKPSSGVSPWRSCCFTNVSGGRPACSPPRVTSLPLLFAPLPDPETEAAPREVAFPSLLGPPRGLCCRERPLGWPRRRLLPALPWPRELALPARGHWDLCAQTRSPRVTVNISTYPGLTLGQMCLASHGQEPL